MQEKFSNQANLFEKAQNETLTKLQATLKKDVKIKELEIENEQLRLNLAAGGGHTSTGQKDDHQKLLSFYDFGRFDVSYTRNVASYLLKKKEIANPQDK